MTRVLVVEDEESYSEALAYMLRKEGFEVAIAFVGYPSSYLFDLFVFVLVFPFVLPTCLWVFILLLLF